MSHTPIWRRYLRFVRPDVRADVDDELEFHLAMMVDAHTAQGVDRDEARRRALAEFGDITRARQLCEAIDRRQQRRSDWGEMLESVVRDARFAVRALRRSPGFTATIILTLALGIGASTAIFTIVRGVLLRPFPYADPDRLVRVYERRPRGDDRNVVSAGNYVSWVERARSFAVLGAHMAPYGISLTGDGDPIQVTTTDMTPSTMRALGARPAVGRTLVDEDWTGDGRVVVLSHALWQRRYGADPGVLGRRIVLDHEPYTVVGVMPAEFEFPAPGVDLWRPVTIDAMPANERRSHNWLVVGRLARGASVASASAEMRAIAGALEREFPQFMSGWGTAVVSLREDVVGGVRRLLVILLAGATLLLVVACANIANLLLTRAHARRREMALRGALGAGVGRLVRQLLTESVLVAVFGGLLGTGAAWLMTRGLLALAPSDIPRLGAVRTDVAVLVYALATTVLSGLAFGLAPVARLLAVRRERAPQLHTILRASDDRAGHGRQRSTRAAFLVAQLAVSLVLLTSAGLLLRSAHRLAAVDYGYRPEGLVAMSLDLPRTVYDSIRKQAELYDRILGRARTLPGVTGVAATTEGLGQSGAMTFSFAIEGRPSTNPSGREDPQPLRAVTPDYFQVLGMPVKRGRAFDARDRADAPSVLIINEALARLLWPSSDPVGKRISFEGRSGPWLEIVGVVGDTRANAAYEPAAPAVFIPYAQKRWNWLSWLTVVARTDGSRGADATVAALRAAVWEQDKQLPIHALSSVPDLYRQGNARRRFATVLTGAFAAAALLLGMIGTYGLLSYTVAQRRREFGIRLALGARAAQVTRVVVGEALGIAVVAIALGTVAALGLTRLLGSLLYEVSPADPLTLGAVTVLIVAVAWAAAWVPARRATRIDPAITIRDA